MKVHYIVALSLLTGAAVGGTAIQILHAQAKLMGWRNSPEYQAALKDGEKYARYNIIAVNGVNQ